MKNLNQELKEYTDTELEQELQSRKKERELNNRPKPIDNPDLSRLISECEEYIDKCYLHKEEDDDGDVIHYIFEEALITLYGKDIFNMLNKIKDS